MTNLPATDASRPPISPNAFILLGAWIASGVGLVMAPQAAGVFTFVFVILGWVLAVVAHEFGHAFIAHKAGDPTIAEKGYLSLDPLKYADLGVSIVIPVIAVVLGGIGFPGGAVYLREDLMRTRGWRSLASLAGPLGTLVVLIAIALVLPLFGDRAPALTNALSLLAFLQASALVLNLLPVPGLDGYGVIRPFLPDGVRERLAKIERIGFLILFGLIFFVPGVSGVIFGVAGAVAGLLGVSFDAMGAGWDAFHFWGAAG